MTKALPILLFSQVLIFAISCSDDSDVDGQRSRQLVSDDSRLQSDQPVRFVSLSCGDGVVRRPEQCDDGNTISGDGCSARCLIELAQAPPTSSSTSICGNGILEADEECDDGNRLDRDWCDSNCQIEVGCGNGFLDIDEECDGSSANIVCNPNCTLAECGDGFLTSESGEMCDDGNTISGDWCSSSCTIEPGCGNKVVEGLEECDGYAQGRFCNQDCTWSECGDGVLNEDAGEECEYQWGLPEAGCLPDCTWRTCAEHEATTNYLDIAPECALPTNLSSHLPTRMNQIRDAYEQCQQPITIRVSVFSLCNKARSTFDPAITLPNIGDSAATTSNSTAVMPAWPTEYHSLSDFAQAAVDVMNMGFSNLAEEPYYCPDGASCRCPDGVCTYGMEPNIENPSGDSPINYSPTAESNYCYWPTQAGYAGRECYARITSNGDLATEDTNFFTNGKVDRGDGIMIDLEDITLPYDGPDVRTFDYPHIETIRSGKRLVQFKLVHSENVCEDGFEDASGVFVSAGAASVRKMHDIAEAHNSLTISIDELLSNDGVNGAGSVNGGSTTIYFRITNTINSYRNAVLVYGDGDPRALEKWKLDAFGLLMHEVTHSLGLGRIGTTWYTKETPHSYSDGQDFDTANSVEGSTEYRRRSFWSGLGSTSGTESWSRFKGNNIAGRGGWPSRLFTDLSWYERGFLTQSQLMRMVWGAQLSERNYVQRLCSDGSVPNF